MPLQRFNVLLIAYGAVATFLESCTIHAFTSLTAPKISRCVVDTTRIGQHCQQQSVSLNLFDKMFEEEGALGKGITVGKIQVALLVDVRGKGSIFEMLEDNASWIQDDDEPGSLADLAHDVCLTLLRKKDSWTAACSTEEWYSANDYGDAEAKFNEWANTEAAKFEKEYIPDSSPSSETGGSTVAVVSLVIEIEGDKTRYECFYLVYS